MGIFEFGKKFPIYYHSQILKFVISSIRFIWRELWRRFAISVIVSIVCQHAENRNKDKDSRGGGQEKFFPYKRGGGRKNNCHAKGGGGGTKSFEVV